VSVLWNGFNLLEKVFSLPPLAFASLKAFPVVVTVALFRAWRVSQQQKT